MNDLSTVKPLHSGTFPVPQDDEADAAYTNAPLNLILGFDLETWQILLEELMPSKKMPDGVMTTRKFMQVVSSIREIGLIELFSVIKGKTSRSRMYRRVQVAKSTGVTCLPNSSEDGLGTANPRQKAAVTLNFEARRRCPPENSSHRQPSKLMLYRLAHQTPLNYERLAERFSFPATK